MLALALGFSFAEKRFGIENRKKLKLFDWLVSERNRFSGLVSLKYPESDIFFS